MKNRILITALFLAMSLTNYSVSIAETVLRLATVDNFPPYSFEKNGELTGVAIDVIKEMAKRLDMKVEIKAYPWSRVMRSIEEGFVDGGFSVFENEERKAFCLYSGIVQYETYQVFVNSSKQFSFSDITDLYGKTIGIDRGVFVGKEFDRAVKENKIFLEEVNDMQMLNVKKLHDGRVDAIIGDAEVIPYYAIKAGLGDSIVSIGVIHEKRPAYLVLSKNSKLTNKIELQQKFITTINQIWTDGTYQRIMNLYKKNK